ncbi:MAG TPA: EI24 domain-containing protein [Planctomycetota bacterium]|nr:EI24 domain-containing protein [Planctomycetota bacterium]
MSRSPAIPRCACCGYPGDGAPCSRCGGHARRLGHKTALRVGRGNPAIDVARGVMDVFRSVFALIHEREFIGRLRWPVAANLAAFVATMLLGWLWLAPAFQSWFDGQRAVSAHDGPAIWLVTSWLLLGAPLLDLIAGRAQEPLRLATEQHMLHGSTGGPTPATTPRWRERIVMLVAAVAALPLALGLALVPWVGLPLVVVLGAAVPAIVWFEPPMAARGIDLRHRLLLLRHNRWRALGVGFGLQFAAAVPFVNVLGLAPVATIAATSSYLHFDKRVDGPSAV